MIRTSVSLRSLLMLLCLTLFGASAAQAQCDITVQSPLEGCEPYTFKVVAKNSSSKTPVYYDWSWGDGNGSSGPGIGSTSYIYTQRSGAAGYQVTLVITYSDGSKCTTQLANKVIVYGLPTAQIVVPSTTNLVQCYSKNGVLNSFKFTHNSQRSKDNNPIVKYIWNFGDGDTSHQENPTHSYDSSGTYVISLRVFDSKGCTHSQAYPIPIRVLADIKANMTATGKQGCQASIYTLKNVTDTLGMNIKKFYWDFEDDGIWDDSTKWTNHQVTVTVGEQTARLRLVNRLDCEDDATFKLKNTLAKLEVWFKDTVCWEDAKKGVQFHATEIAGATFYAWNFDDAPDPKNVTPFVWEPVHEFTMNGPKNYSVRFSVQHPICGKLDTCVILHVMGPQATIRLSSPPFSPNNYVPTQKKMPAVYFTVLNNGIAPFPGACDSFPYAYFVPVTKKVTKKSYCNAPVNKTLSQIIYCNFFWKSPYWCATCPLTSPSADTQIFVSSVTLTPTSTKVTTVNDSVEVWAWYHANTPLPKNPYFRSTGSQRFGPNMHDTNLYTCKMPNYVRFSNFSTKYRLYKTLDDKPTAYVDNTWWDIPNEVELLPGPGGSTVTYPFNVKLGWPYAHTEEDWTMDISKRTVINLLGDLIPPPNLVSNGYVDSCVNKNFPYASDSLRYFWDFGDGDQTCTSSVTNKNWDCQYSTVAAPYHNFKKAPPSGCATVQMWAYDDVMGCKDKATQQLRQSPPKAWWDRGVNGYSFMTWELQHQNAFKPATPEDETDAFPHLGLRLGIPNQKLNCTGSRYRFNIGANGQIMPTCGAQKYWVLFDSAAVVIDTFCKVGSLTVKYRDYGFIGRGGAPAATAVRGISKGYPIGAPDSYWANLPWQGNYWWFQGDTGCKTVGFVVQNGACFDTAWYHDYICFTRLSPQFSLHRIDTLFTYQGNDPINGKINDTTVNYVAIGTSLDINEGHLGYRNSNVNIPYKLSPRKREREGTDILLLPLDREMPRVKKFIYTLERREFPNDQFYYHMERAGDKQKGIWPDSASLNPFRVKPLPTDTDACMLWARRGNRDSVTSIQDTIFYTLYDLDHNLFTIRYDGAQNITSDTNLIDGTRFFLLPKEYNALKKNGVFYLSYRDMRARPFGWKTPFGGIPIYYRTKVSGTVPVADTAFFLDFMDPTPEDSLGMITDLTNQNIVITLAIAGHTTNALNGKKVSTIDLSGVNPTSPKPFYLKFNSGKYELYSNAALTNPVTGIGKFSAPGFVQTMDKAVKPSRYGPGQFYKDDAKEYNDGAMRFALHDSVRMHIPWPGFYTVLSEAYNADGCDVLGIYHFIHGHFAKFWVKGTDDIPEGDSIICAGDTIRFLRTVRYWTTNCPPLPSGVIPEGCVSGPGAFDGGLPLGEGTTQIVVQLYPWDFQDVVAYRKSLLPAYKSSNSFRAEVVEWNYGDDNGFYKEGTPGKFGEGFHIYKKPGVYDVTMRTRDSLGYYVYTTRRKLINVIQVDANFVVSPLRDTHSICAPKDIVYRDQTRLLGSDVDKFGKFYNKHKVVVPKANDPGCYEIRDSSFLMDSIQAWTWDPGQAHQPPITRVNTDSLIFDYRANGQYDVSLKVVTANLKPRRCTDEEIKKKYVRISGPKPKFELLDTAGCAPFIARVRNTSSNSYMYSWYKGDGGQVVNSSWLPKDSIVKLVYPNPGRYRITMIQQDSLYDPVHDTMIICTSPVWPDSIFDDTSFWVTVYPFSPIVITGDTVICPNVPTKYTATSTYGEFIEWKWTTSDGQSYNSTHNKDSSAIFTWAKPGNYQIKVQGKTLKNCEIDTVLNIRVDSIRAKFRIDDKHKKIGKYVFINESVNAVKYKWTVRDMNNPGRVVPGFDEEKNDKSDKPFEFSDLAPATQDEAPDTAVQTDFKFEICLIAYSPIGCPDTFCDVVTFPRAYKPWNVITPDDGDGKNDVFDPHIKGETAYNLEIFNRWGEKVFESNSSDIDWNGKVNNTGAPCPAGTYYFVWRFTLVGGVEKTIHGTVTILRDKK